MSTMKATVGKAAGKALSIAALMWVCIRRIGLAPHDVALAFAVAGFAMSQRLRDRGGILGEADASVVVRWGEFVRDEHQVRSHLLQYPARKLHVCACVCVCKAARLLCFRPYSLAFRAYPRACGH